jgi:oligosaccharide repeat unit polymerase
MINPVQAKAEWTERIRATLAKRLKYLFFAWIVLVAFELFSFGNLPFLSIVGVGEAIGYEEYGFSGLHGLLNAMQLVLFDMALLFYIRGRSVKYLFYGLALIAWSVLLVSRAIIVASFIQGIMIGLLFSKSFRKRFLLLGSVITFLVILVFGVLGDIRSSSGTSIQALAQQSSDYPGFLPPGFFWVYVYITTPLNNINANIGSMSALGFPYYSILPLIPNVIRAALNINDLDVTLVDENLNVSSFFRQFIFDYGVYGTILVMTILYFMFSLVMKKSKNNEKWALILVVILYCTIISVFVNAYTAIIYLAQMLLFGAIYYRVSRGSIRIR